MLLLNLRRAWQRSKLVLALAVAQTAISSESGRILYQFFLKKKALLSEEESAALSIIYRRLQYHRADGELLEGAVTLLVASPLLELAGLCDPPYKRKPEATVEITINDGEEILRGRIDALILQNRLWVLVIEAKKTTIPLRSALPQLLTYLMANPQSEQPLYGLLTNGDEMLFVKLTQQQPAQYDLSRAFSLYATSSEVSYAFQILKRISLLLA